MTSVEEVLKKAESRRNGLRLHLDRLHQAHNIGLLTDKDMERVLRRRLP